MKKSEKRKVGRPPVDSVARTEVLPAVRVTPQELAKYQKAAKKAESWSAWVRAALDDAAGHH